MSVSDLAGKPMVKIRGKAYPVLLPSPRDPRLHLAAVIISLQVLGQVAFDFRLSIAQILIALGTSALLEIAIAFRRQVIMWPASALLTGNGVAFILRVPGTEHGDWWSLRGWWIFAGAAAISLLSKHLIRVHGKHVFNPSNFGLVLCFLVLGVTRADPLEFWWAPMSGWMLLALLIIVAGGFAILTRLHLLGIAVLFWVTFAAGMAVLAVSGHTMTARWHLEPISGAYFWWVLVTSPELLVFLFFMITDPKTIPSGRLGQRLYAVGIGLLASLLIAPQSTEFGTKVALLAALALACGARALVLLAPRATGGARWLAHARSHATRGATAGVAVLGAAAFAGLLVLAGIPARTDAGAAGTAAATSGVAQLPQVTVARSTGVASAISAPTAKRIARDIVADLRVQADALQRRDATHVATAASGSWLIGLKSQIGKAETRGVRVPAYTIEHIRLHLEPGEGQAPPIVVAECRGSVVLTTYGKAGDSGVRTGKPTPFVQTFDLQLLDDRFRITRSRHASIAALATPAAPVVAAPLASPAVTRAAEVAFAGVRLTDVAKQVGLDFRQGSFRFGVDGGDEAAMMGGGLCWLDYDGDGWMDLFAVNSYADANIAGWQANGGLPRSALFHNVRGRFVDVSKRSHADLAIRGSGCVAADFDGDGNTDLYVTSAVGDALLQNNGDGTFSERARASGLVSFGWHAGAAVADVNGDGRPDLFVAGYTNVFAPIPGSVAGFPTNHEGVRSELFLNLGNDAQGHPRFRDVSAAAGLPTARFDHSLGAVFSDFDGDGRSDLYVANDEDPNRLYRNVPWPGGATADPKGLGFRLVDRARREGVADTNAGMGVAAADYDGDGATDVFVSNSRGQTHAIYRARSGALPFANGRPAFAAAFGSNFTGWGDSWVDLNRDGHLDLVLANGAIPVTNLAKDAAPIQAIGNLAGVGLPGNFANVSGPTGLRAAPLVNGRGLAAADFNNDGNVDIAINTIGGRLVLLDNRNTAGHWLAVSLKGFHPGAIVTAELPGGRKLVREVQAGSSYLSSEDPRVFFGLGKATRVRSLVVRYPGGRTTRLTGVKPDRILTLRP
jgi:ASPIC and UnbV/FG-GAP-like repeat/NQR2, RnfD, RnfE family